MKLTQTLASILCIIIIATTGCGKAGQQGGPGGHPGGPPGGGPPGMPVVTEVLDSRILNLTSDYLALLTSKKSTGIYPRVNGPIQSILVEEGDFVKAGSTLMTIEQSEPLAQFKASQAQTTSTLNSLSVAEATLESIHAQKESAEADLTLKKTEYIRYKNLYNKGSVTQQNLDQVTADLEKSQAALKAIEKEIKAQEMLVKARRSDYIQAQESTKQSQITFDYYNIPAPFDGIVGDIPVKIGEYVTPQKHLTTLTANYNLEVNIPVELSKADVIKKGMRVDILNAQDETVATTEIYFISPSINQDTQTILAKALLDNQQGKFKADQQVQARIYLDTFKGVSVPTDAVQHFAGKDFVYIIKTQEGKKTAQQVPVDLAAIQENRYVIRSGLEAGQEIVISGIQKLRDGAPVMITNNAKNEKPQNNEH
jgi:multidrug efflux pump subunit AcrA (membrane-fusion protein)